MGSQLSICLSIYWPHWPLHPRCCQAEVGLRDPGDLDLGRPQLPSVVRTGGATLSRERDRPSKPLGVLAEGERPEAGHLQTLFSGSSGR